MKPTQVKLAPTLGSCIFLLIHNSSAWFSKKVTAMASSFPFPTHILFTLLALAKFKNEIGMSTLANFFVEVEGLKPYILLSPHFFATLEFCVHDIHEFEHFKLEFHPT